jgi:PIN domain nuclease of toxin-antitoxin system
MEPVKGYLLDTHVFIWALQEKHKLGDRARLMIEDPTTRIYVSAISAFEIIAKYRMGRLPRHQYIAEKPLELMNMMGVEELPVTTQHTTFAAKFQWEHEDPSQRRGVRQMQGCRHCP